MMDHGDAIPLLSRRAEKKINDDSQYPTKSWRAIIASASLVLCVVGAVAAFPEASFRQELESTTSSSGLTLEVTNEYDPVQSKSMYGWKHIAEPHKTSTLTASSLCTTCDVSDYAFTWTIQHADAEGTTVDFSQTGYGLSSITTEFTKAGQEYLVTCSAVMGDKELSFSEIVVSKYVRREIRQLKKADREKYLAATEIFHRTDAATGRKMYGSKFTNYEEITVKHLSRMTLDKCTPYHGHNAFLTSHESFVLEHEQALQTIDPSISMPFWDFTIDTKKYGDVASMAASSPIFEYDWFGPLDNSATDEVLTSKYFTNLPVPQDSSSPEHNGYGFITDSINSNPSSLVTRSSSICGLPTKAYLSSCSDIEDVIATTSLTSLRSTIENQYHATMHMGIGGTTDCPVSLADAITNDAIGGPSRVALFENIAMMANTVWRTMQFSGNMVCATDCDSSSSSDSSCLCSCPSFDSLSSTELEAIAYDTLADVGVTQMLQSEETTADYFTTNEEGIIVLKDATAEVNNAFWAWLVTFTCHPGSINPFATPLAATNDPIFWVSHASWGRFWHYIQLNEELWSNFDSTWGREDFECEDMLNEDDYLPFSGFSEATTSVNERYTNSELVKFFAPKNLDLPYMFDKMTWDHCNDA